MTELPHLSLSLIGQDTEYFLWDTKKQQVYPSWKHFPQKKKALKATYEAFPLGHWSGRDAYLYRDGLAVEVNSGPVTCRAWLWEDQKLTLQKLRPAELPQKVIYTTRPVVEVNEALRASFPKDVAQLGCSPTMDAYTGRQKIIKVDPRTLPFRSIGAHLHISFTQQLHPAWHQPFIKLADLLLGLPFTYIFADELEFKRRTLYGAAGEYRIQRSYGGIEYRVLSPRLYNHPAIMGLFTGIWKHLLGSRALALWSYWDSAWEVPLQLAINTGEGLEELLPIWDKVTFPVLRPFGFEGSSSIWLWKKLRELNLAGKFPDAGIANYPFPDAHDGWREYWAFWRTGEEYDYHKPIPRGEPDPFAEEG